MLVAAPWGMAGSEDLSGTAVRFVSGVMVRLPPSTKPPGGSTRSGDEGTYPKYAAATAAQPALASDLRFPVPEAPDSAFGRTQIPCRRPPETGRSTL